MSREPTEQEIEHRTETLLARRRAWEQHTNMGQFVSTLQLETYTTEIARLEAIEQLRTELADQHERLTPREVRRRYELHLATPPDWCRAAWSEIRTMSSP